MTRFLPKHAERIALIACVALTGCKLGAVQEVHQSALEKENRELEDQIYYLEDVISGFEMRLESAQRENAALKSNTGRDDAPVTTTPPPRRDTVAPPANTGDAPGDGDLRPPKIELGPEADLPTPGPQGASRPPIGNSGVAAIVINRWLSGGADTDGRDGHEGVLAVIEPRDAQGQLVHAPAEMTLTITDPAETGNAARVATWKFTTDEIAARFRVHPPGAGIHLQMPWPNEPPRNRQLKLEVSYRAPDGRVLVAEHPMRIVPPADHSLIVKSEESPKPTTKKSPEPATTDSPPAIDATNSSTPAQTARPQWSPTRR